jgi:DsbC/DsbD-like thiol-disulfide interchange protein
MRTIPILLIFAIFLSNEGFTAITSDGDGNRAQVTLISQHTTFDSPFYIGLRFNMEPGWYIYWKNPGDAGIPVESNWTLPDGFIVGELIYPTPQKFESGGIVSYGYSGETILLAQVIPPAGFSPSSTDIIEGNISWMVCKESCYLEQGSVHATLNRLRFDDEKIDAIMQRIPNSIENLDLVLERAIARDIGGHRIIEIKFEGSDISRIEDYYPDAFRNFVVTHADIKLENGKIEFAVTPYNQSATLHTVGGLVIVDGNGYEFSVPLTTIQ